MLLESNEKQPMKGFNLRWIAKKITISHVKRVFRLAKSECLVQALTVVFARADILDWFGTLGA